MASSANCIFFSFISLRSAPRRYSFISFDNSLYIVTSSLAQFLLYTSISSSETMLTFPLPGSIDRLKPPSLTNMPPPSPSFPLSDSRSLRLPPPSSLYTSIPPPSPSIYSPGPLPSPRYLDGYPSEHKYFGPYAGMPLTVTPPQTPGIYPPSPNSMHRKLPSPFSVPSLISDRSQLDSLSDASSSSAESTPHGSPKFERKNYWGAYSPPTSENESRSSSVSSFSDSHDEAKEEEAKCEKQQQQQQEEQQQVTGNKRRRSMESEEEVEEVGISKRRR